MVVAIAPWADSLAVEGSPRRNFIKIESEPFFHAAAQPGVHFVRCASIRQNSDRSDLHADVGVEIRDERALAEGHPQTLDTPNASLGGLVDIGSQHYSRWDIDMKAPPIRRPTAQCDRRLSLGREGLATTTKGDTN
jgi:hypothetical protein